MNKVLVAFMGIFFVLIIGCNSTGGTKPQQKDNQLSVEELKSFYTDKTTINVHHKRGPGKTYFGADGSLHSISDMGEERVGKWWIDDQLGMRCISWNNSSKNFCHHTVRNEDSTHTLIHRRSGAKLVEIKENIRGNQL